MKHTERIEKYLTDELSKEERMTFEQDCQTNQLLAEELAFYLQARHALKASKIAALNQRYSASKENHAIRRRNRIYIRVAASAAAIILFIWLGLPTFQSYQINNQLANYDTSIFFLNEQITRSDDTTENNLTTIFNAFENQDYPSIINLVDTSNNPSILAIQALAHFELENYEVAAATYEQYLENDIEYFEKIRAQWNLILVYRALRNKSAEQKILEDLGKQGQKDILKALQAE